MKQEFIKSKLLSDMTKDGFNPSDIAAVDTRHGELVSLVNIIYASDISPYSKYFMIMKYVDLSTFEAIELANLFVASYAVEHDDILPTNYHIVFNPKLSKCLINWYNSKY